MHTGLPPAPRPARRIVGIGVSEILAIGARATQLRRVEDAASAVIRAGATMDTAPDGTAAVAAGLWRENGLPVHGISSMVDHFHAGLRPRVSDAS